jgi:hypothetical protein
MQGGARRLALLVITELLCARSSHQLKRFAVAVDYEYVYLSFAVLTGLLDGNVRDLLIWGFAFSAGGVLKENELKRLGISLPFVIQIVLPLAIEVLKLTSA